MTASFILTLCIVGGLIATGLLFALALCRAAADTRDVRPDEGEYDA